MWKKIAISGAVAAAVLGSGAVALAETTSGSTPSTTPSAGAATAPTAGKPGAKVRAAVALRSIEHGEWTTRDKSGTDVVHDAIGGTVSAVSATSITVKAADGFSATYSVGPSTKVHVKGTKPATITNVKVNDRVVLAGTKAGTTITATQVLDAGPK